MILQRIVIGMVLIVVSVTASGAPYTLNPGDVLSISVWNEEALQQEVMVLPDGTISFPLVGIIQVSSKTPAQVQEQIKKRLSRVIPDIVLIIIHFTDPMGLRWYHRFSAGYWFPGPCLW